MTNDPNPGTEPVSNYPREGMSDVEYMGSIKGVRQKMLQAYGVAISALVVGLACLYGLPGSAGSTVWIACEIAYYVALGTGAYYHSKFKDVATSTAVLVVIFFSWLGVLLISLRPYRRATPPANFKV